MAARLSSGDASDGFFPERLFTSITELLHQDSSARSGAAGNSRSRFQAVISPGAAGAAGSPHSGRRGRGVTAIKLLQYQRKFIARF